MKSQALQELVKKIFGDEKTKGEFKEDPDGFLSRYNLTDQEKTAVLKTHAKLGLVTSGSEQLEATLEAISPDFVNHDPIWPEITDYESYKEYIAFEFEPINLRVDDLIAEGDKVAERWTIDMGEGVMLSGMSIHRFADGKIVERWWSKDLLQMLQQEGVVPMME